MSGTSLFRAAAVAIFLAGSLPAQAHTDFDPDVDFTSFKTFSFVPAANAAPSGALRDSKLRERIRNFIAGALEGRGLTETPKDQKHDLAIRFWAAVQNKQSVEVNMAADPMWLGWGGYPPYWNGIWGCYYDEWVVRNYKEGILVIDLIDPTTKELVWRTFLLQDLSDPVKADAKLRSDLAKSFSQLPPSEKAREEMQAQRKKAISQLQ